MFKRYKLTNAFFQDALSLSNEKGKKLLVIGDPCGGTYFQFITKYFLDYGHGDVTIDLFGCKKCTRMDINDMEAWSTFEDDSFVVMETGTLSFSTDIRKCSDSNQENIRRTISFCWKYTWFFVGKFHS